MSEPFPRFGASFRTWYASTLAISSTAIFAGLAILLANQESMPRNYFLVFVTSILFLLASIIIALTSIVKGMYSESRDGYSSGELNAREVNFMKFKYLVGSTICLMLGLFLEVTSLTLAAASETEKSTQTEASPPQNCQSDGYKQFDFWLGEWDVYDTNNELAGTNSIIKAEGGCLIVEKWTATNGTTGQSYNYYNPATDEWRQVWVSQGAIIDYAGGLLESGTMHLEGTLTYQASKKNYKFVGHWIPLDSGEVRQEFELYDPETDSWNEWFTGIYKRQAD